MRKYVLGEWVNPDRERQTIPQGKTSSPSKSLLIRKRFKPTERFASTHTFTRASSTDSITHRTHTHTAADENIPTEKFEWSDIQGLPLTP